jgi:hypothetical protein
MKYKLILLSLIVLSLFAAANGQSQWKEFKSAGHQFSTQVPCEIETSKENIGTAEAPQVQTFYECSADGVYYNISVNDVLKGSVTDEVLLSSFQKGMLEGFGGTLMSENVIALGPVPGRRVTASAKLGEIDALIECRLFKNGDRIFSVAVVAATTNKSPEKTRFLTSFKFQNK